MNILNIKNCTGCMLCEKLCPHNCIYGSVNEEGFIYPKVDILQCIDCGICYKKCPANNDVELEKVKRVYAAQRKNKESLKQSSSGGIAALLSEYVIENGGVVYGCAFDKNLKALHIRCTDKKELEELKGSKYVQSDFSSVYETLVEDCKSGKIVLIIGTPCQCAAVKKLLGNKYNNFILVDLICHGVPSPDLFKKYLFWKSDKMGGGPILKYNFRDKEKYDWGTTYKAATATATATATADPYYESFIYAENYRECCYNCKYAQIDRVGDITIGDYWGIQKLHPEFNVDITKGVSVVLVNDEKGKSLFEKINSKLNFIESDIEKAMIENSNLYAPAKQPKIRSEFYKKVNENGFVWVNKKMYMNKRFYINLLKNKMPIKMKKFIKKLIGRE